MVHKRIGGRDDLATPLLCCAQASLTGDSRVCRDQERHACRKQRFAALADVVYELEETEGKRCWARSLSCLFQKTPDPNKSVSHLCHSLWHKRLCCKEA